AGDERTGAGFLELTELHGKVARQADGVLYRDRLREALDAGRLEFGQVKLEQIRPRYPEPRAGEIVEGDDGEVAVLLERQSALSQPACAPGEVEVPAHQTIGELGHRGEERAVGEALRVVNQQITAQLGIGLCDGLRELRDGYVALFQIDQR